MSKVCAPQWENLEATHRVVWLRSVITASSKFVGLLFVTRQWLCMLHIPTKSSSESDVDGFALAHDDVERLIVSLVGYTIQKTLFIYQSDRGRFNRA